MLQALVAYKGSKNIIRCGQNNFQFKPGLKWENFYFSNLVRGIRRKLKTFGEHSWFLVGELFLREPSSVFSTY